jgi:truncated hemoglobin YjbI
MKLEFDHSKTSFTEAINVSQKEIKKLNQKAQEIITKCDKISEITEKFYNDFSKEELVVLTTHIYQNLIDEREQHHLLKKFLTLGSKSQKNEKEDQN